MNGERMNQGVQLAVDEGTTPHGGSQLGKQVELDDRGRPDPPGRGRDLCAVSWPADGVAGIVGPSQKHQCPGSGGSGKAGRRSCLHRRHHPAASRTLDNDYLFRCRASDSIFAEAAAAYAKELWMQETGTVL